MNKTLIAMVLLTIGLLVLTGCTESSTGNAASPPPYPTGGGCGVAAPANSPFGSLASTADPSTAA